MTDIDPAAVLANAEPRRRGRPPKPKKGKPTWRPAEQLLVDNKDPNFVYRWCAKDPANLARKRAEGWQPVNGLTGMSADHERPETVMGGSPLTGVTEYRELVLMALPKDIAEARRAHFNEQTDRQARGVKDRLTHEISSAARAEQADRAETYGRIVIE